MGQGQEVIVLESTDAVVRLLAAQLVAYCYGAFILHLAQRALDLPLTEVKQIGCCR